MEEESLLVSQQQLERKEKVKARWAILRTALLRGAHDEQQRQKHSIHRFEGYNLLSPRKANEFCHKLEPFLTEYRWNEDGFEQTWEDKRNHLEIAILALAACFPKGKCIRIISTHKQRNDDSLVPKLLSDERMSWIKERCHPSVSVWKVSEEIREEKEFCRTKKTPFTTLITTLLVQEACSSTKYQVLCYDIDRKNKRGENESDRLDGPNPSAQTDDSSSGDMIILTREPKETRLSLDDLVSHRKNNGVDNTGNICVWDSERTLAYLLNNHVDDFFTLFQSERNGKKVIRLQANLLSDTSMDCSQVRNQECECENPSDVRILELGTGMAGLSAVALGFRLACLRQKIRVDEEGSDSTSQYDSNKEKKANIRITLTDGNVNGVKNNSINQYLTKLSSMMMLKKNGTCSEYLDLDVKCETMLWTTDVGTGDKKRHLMQDVVLISDCVHFQNFHAALAITTLKCLRVGGIAIFCQPTRGQSLGNFSNLLSTASSTGADDEECTPLLCWKWLSHPAIETKHHEASTQHADVYDENLHYPKILVVTKLRELLEDDRMRFVGFQERYSPVRPS